MATRPTPATCMRSSRDHCGRLSTLLSLGVLFTADTKMESDRVVIGARRGVALLLPADALVNVFFKESNIRYDERIHITTNTLKAHFTATAVHADRHSRRAEKRRLETQTRGTLIKKKNHGLRSNVSVSPAYHRRRHGLPIRSFPVLSLTFQ